MIDTTDPKANYPSDQMYVNQGTDRRIQGSLGRRLALIQRLHSFKSEYPPERRVEQLEGGALFEIQRWPNGREHWAFAIPYGIMRRDVSWATFRVGWRYDANWGDANVKGYNPEPEIVGGAILDVVIKLRAKAPFIEIPQ